MPNSNRAKAKLAAGGIAVGVSVVDTAPGLAEMLGDLGFDLLIADGEHGPVTDAGFEALVRAAEGSGAAAMIRTRAEGWHLGRYFDIGALGVQVPMLRSREHAAAVVDAIKFPPEGSRGFGNARVRRYGPARMTAEEFVAWSNRETLTIFQVENREGFEALPRVLQVPGVDVVMVGTHDLSQSLGVTGQVEHASVLEIVNETVRLVTAAGKIAGLPAGTAAEAERQVARGARYLLCSSTAVVEAGARSILAGLGQG